MVWNPGRPRDSMSSSITASKNSEARAKWDTKRGKRSQDFLAGEKCQIVYSQRCTNIEISLSGRNDCNYDLSHVIYF